MTEKEWELIQVVRKLVQIVKKILNRPPDIGTASDIYKDMTFIEHCMDEEEDPYVTRH